MSFRRQTRVQQKNLQWPTSLWTFYAIYAHNTVSTHRIIVAKVQNIRDARCFCEIESKNKQNNMNMIEKRKCLCMQFVCLCAHILNLYGTVWSGIIIDPAAHSSCVSSCYNIDLTEETDWLQTSGDMQSFLFWDHSVLSHHHMDEVIMWVGLPILKAYITQDVFLHSVHIHAAVLLPKVQTWAHFWVLFMLSSFR